MDITSATVRKGAVVLTVVTFVVAGASAAAYFVVDRETNRLLFNYFYVGEEMNLPTWWNVVLLFAVALAALVAAACVRRERASWLLVAATAAFLSLDEGSRLHERLGALTGGVEVATFRWVVAAAVLAPVGLVALWLLTRALPARTRRLLGMSVAVYVFAALGLEALGGHMFYRDEWGAFLALTHVEELLEMLACVGATAAILQRLVPLRIDTTPSVEVPEGRQVPPSASRPGRARVAHQAAHRR